MNDKVINKLKFNQMSNNQKYIVLPGGKECKPVNRAEKSTAYNFQQFVDEFSYDEFVKIAKISNHESIPETMVTKTAEIELEGACVSGTCSNCAGISCALIHVRNPEWNAIEATAPIYALTEVMPDGVDFSGEEVWQILYGRTKWVTDVEKRFDTFLEFSEYWFDRATRLAIKPLKAIEPVKALKNLKN